ncbi:hypothetical protein M422DRAFT_258709 [Sphaerobolus stellatus SS14]|uniref:Uncharacterized protein n=1 Tax=Sphaerobolus stellatus (strain SS14) TaxID=990650 RepID=A0A0C9VLA5_SPHS4|nr:hypothetical protein M422DRAFT_258709 [Sphaerobolus stellatus SS14]
MTVGGNSTHPDEYTSTHRHLGLNLPNQGAGIGVSSSREHPQLSAQPSSSTSTRATAGQSIQRQRINETEIVPSAIPGTSRQEHTGGSRGDNPPLSERVLAKFIRAFKAFDYVPYTVLTYSARTKAENSEQEMELCVDGTFAAASKLAVELACQHWQQGDIRADTLSKHHDIVTELADSHGWPMAMSYDIRQREIMHRTPQHDVSHFNESVLGWVTTKLLIENASLARGPYPSPPLGSHK